MTRAIPIIHGHYDATLGATLLKGGGERGGGGGGTRLLGRHGRVGDGRDMLLMDHVVACGSARWLRLRLRVSAGEVNLDIFKRETYLK